MAVKLNIINSALTKIGVEVISAVTDDNVRARTMNTLYDGIKEDLLGSHPWNFAIRRVELGVLATTPEFEYTYEFQLPSDCIRVLLEEYQDHTSDYQIEGRKLLTNNSTMKVSYISNVDEGEMTPMFAELLAYRLANEVCFSLTQNASMAEAIDKRYDKKLREVRSYDAQEGGRIRRIDASEWVDARR